MSSSLLSVHNLVVAVADKMVLDGVDLEIAKGEVVALMGANGSGKSSLANMLMGNPEYAILAKDDGESKIKFLGKDLLSMTADERVKMGLYVVWQNPVTIPGLSVFSLCKSIYEAQGNRISELVAFKKKLEDLATQVGLPKDYVSRNVNEGFSGGERKRLELMQMLLLNPKLAILDEVDSGLDAEGVKIVIKIVNKMKLDGSSFILITHNKKLLEEIKVDKVCEMKYGRLSTGV